jgi:hypothetical protein
VTSLVNRNILKRCYWSYWYEHGDETTFQEENLWWKPCVEKTERLPREQLPFGIDAGWFVYDIPIISTQTYMKWLQNQVDYLFHSCCESSILIDKESQIVSKGARLIEGKITSVEDVISKFKLKDVKCVINCLGLGARDVVHDSNTFPIRGVVVRVIPDKVLSFHFSNFKFFTTLFSLTLGLSVEPSNQTFLF